MSCKSCSSGSAKVSPPPTPLAKVKPMSLSPAQSPVNKVIFRSVTGSMVGYPTTLVSQRPVTGWSAAFTINGVSVSVSSATPEAAIAGLVSLATSNGLKMTHEDAWLWLNYSWMNISPVKRHKVDFTEVSRVVVGGGANPEVEGALNVVVRNWVEDYTPSKWGSIAWRWLGFLLVDENADLSLFVDTLHIILNKLDPEKSPLTGCIECFTHFSDELETLPDFSGVMEARKWLWTFHNSVNSRIKKPMLTWTKACQENMWAYSDNKTSNLEKLEK